MSRKLLILVVVSPVLLVLAFASSSIQHHHERFLAAEAIADFAEMSSVLLDLNRSLQKERSFSVWYRSEPTEANQNMLSAQKAMTDSALHELSLILEAQVAIHDYWGLREEFSVLIGGLQSLESTRVAVFTDGIDPSEYYADINKEIHKIIRYQQVLTNDIELARRTDTLTTLLKLEESVWQERDVVKEIVKQGRVDAYQYRLTNSLIASQESLLESFFQAAPEHQLNQISDRLTGPVIAEFSLLRETILRYAVDRSTREELLDGLVSLISYRGVIYPFYLQLPDKYLDHLLAIKRDQKDLVERLVLMPELEDDARLLTLQTLLETADLAIGNKESTGLLGEVDQQTIQLIRELKDRNMPLAVPEWRMSSFERIKLFESLTLVAWHRMIDRTSELISYSRGQLIEYLVYLFALAAACLFFSYLVVARYLQTRQLNVQNRLLELEKQHNHELEERVDERTRDLLEATNRAELANQAKSRFLGNVSHHIRTPLNAILGFNQMLLEDESLLDLQRRRLEMVGDNGARLLDLVEDILLLVDLESGEKTATVATFEPRDFLDRLASRFTKPAKGSGLQLEVSVDEKIPAVVQADVGKIDKVLSILLDNAIKFTPSGTVWLRLDCGSDGRLVGIVEDSGSGIDIHRQDELLKGFEQDEDGCNTGYGGLGIGLTIASRLAELMQGSLSLMTAATGGLRVEVRIPVKVVQREVVEAALAEPHVEAAVALASPIQTQISKNLTAEISQALDAADYLLLLELSEQVGASNTEAGDQMKQLVETYNYDGLTHMLEGMQASR